MYIMCRFEGRATSLDDIRRVMESQAVKPSGAGVRTLPEGFVVRWAPLPVLAPLQLYDLCFCGCPGDEKRMRGLILIATSPSLFVVATFKRTTPGYELGRKQCYTLTQNGNETMCP